MQIWKDEQTKLTATFLNNVSVATITAGVLVPGFSLFYGTSVLTPPQAELVRLSLPTLFVIGIALHSLGRLVLRSVGRDQ